ncbi:MAG: PEP-utilizing enzyme [Patescibacteria group bacterium]
MKNVKKTNWRVYVRDRVYPQGISAYLDLIFRRDVRQYPYFSRHYEVMSFVGNNFWWARDLDLMEKKFHRWFSAWIHRPGVFSRFVRQFERTLNKMRIALPDLKHKMLRAERLSDRELYVIYARGKRMFWDNITLSEYTVDLFDDYFDGILAKALEPYRHLVADPGGLITMMKPAYLSVVQQYQRELLRLSGKQYVSMLDFTDVLNRLDWIVMSWDGGHVITPEKARRDLRPLKKMSTGKRRAMARRIDNYATDILRQRARIFRKYHLPRKILWRYFAILDQFSQLHDWRKEGQTRCSQIVFKALQEMSRRFRIPFASIVYYMNDEVRSLCSRGERVSGKVLRARRTGLTWVINGNKFQEATGRHAYRLVKALVLDQLRARREAEVRGIPANHGLVRGRVLRAMSAREANSLIRKGDVLVASMTTVDYVPAMHKAAAIVTDDGGLNCHAAIVARELGVPCIVGTKIATQVFKTGDRIEVDATSGIVRKI